MSPRPNPIHFWLAAQTIFAWVFLVVDLVLLGGFIYAYRKLLGFRPNIKPGKRHPIGMASPQLIVFRERWEGALRRFNTSSPEAMRFSILEADMLVDSILKDSGIEGATMADRLTKLTPDTVKSLNALWKAHRLRNKLEETAEYEVPLGEAQEAIQGYEAFLKEIKVLI